MKNMKIQASRCTHCSRTIVPPRDVCPYCGKAAGKMIMQKIDGKGTVLSYTTLEMPPEGFNPPLTMALVQLNQGAVILCLAGDEENGELRIGARVIVDADSDDRFRFYLLH